jgi:uncharacterized protein (DUF1778 family)
MISSSSRDVRESRVNLRLTLAEYSAIESAAWSVGLRPTTFARMTVLRAARSIALVTSEEVRSR